MSKIFTQLLILIFTFGWLLPPAQGQVALQVLRSFGNAGQSGDDPEAAVLVGADGALYGTTAGGGPGGSGTVFKVNTNGTGYKVLHNFKSDGTDGEQPLAGLIQGRDGALYGTTAFGGSNFVGTVFKLSPDGSGYQVLHGFSSSGNDGQNPSSELMQGQDGALYGTASGGGVDELGTVFRIRTNGLDYAVLYSFSLAGNDGQEPSGGLVQAPDGKLYGAAPFGGDNGFGAVFQLSTNGTGYVTLHSFGDIVDDGATPYASLKRASDGKLYGTTYEGGSDGIGTVFRLTTDGATYDVLHSFTYAGDDGQNPVASLLRGADGAFYGTTTGGGSNGVGTFFKLNANGAGYARLRDFGSTGRDAANPRASLVQTGDGGLFGTAADGGIVGFGAVYRLSTNGANYAVIYAFSNSGRDAANARSLLVQGFDGALYGTTQQGGTNGNDGTVFKLNPDGTGYAILHNFTNKPDGAAPGAGLLQGRDGALFGTTAVGGLYGLGTVFKLNTNGTGYSILHDFANLNDGAKPAAPLIQALDGRLYGTTSSGNGSEGTLFRLETNGANYAPIFLFQSVNLLGYRPLAAVLQGSDGLLYGTTALGGNSAGSGKGVIFRVDTNGQGYAVLHNFGATPGDGSAPRSALVQAADGALCGMSSSAVFTVQTNGTGFAVLHALNLEYAAGITLGGDGLLYGLRSSASGGKVAGLFRLATSGGNYTIFQNPSPAPDDPGVPFAPLLQARDGAFCGTTDLGGAMNLGTVYRLSLAPAPQILSPQLSGTNFTFSLQTTNGQSYTVQSSTNLATANWTFYTNVTGSGSLMQFIVPIIAAPPERFFRVSVP